MPIGSGAVAAGLGELVARMFGLMFTLGVRLAAPMTVILLIVEVAMGVTARVAPTLNLMVTAAPVRLLVGWMAARADAARAAGSPSARALPHALTLGARTAAAFH